jgi:RNA polymerase sigma-70 factor, ECF subfamily
MAPPLLLAVGMRRNTIPMISAAIDDLPEEDQDHDVVDRDDHPSAVALDTGRLYRDYAAAVTRWAGRMARSASDAEDIVQEVFLVVERRRRSLPLLRNPAAWLYRITANIVRRRWRDKTRHALARAQLLETFVDESPTPFDDLEHRRTMERLDRALGAIGAKDRRLLWLCDVRRLPTSRISALTGIKPQTLRVRRFRARMQVARRMRDAEKNSNRIGVDDRRKKATCRPRPASMGHAS